MEWKKAILDAVSRNLRGERHDEWSIRFMSAQDRGAMDDFLVKGGHSLAQEPGTFEYRFGRMVDIISEQCGKSPLRKACDCGICVAMDEWNTND